MERKEGGMRGGGKGRQGEGRQQKEEGSPESREEGEDLCP